MPSPPPLRFLTYLSPGLPRGLFEGLARHVALHLGIATELAVEERFSGPPPGELDPFTAGTADVGFLCAPPYLWLRGLDPAPVELAGALPVFRDPRAAGRPVYFSDVIVRRDSPARSFRDLRGGSWAYNDPCSLSGYHCLLRALRRVPPEAFFRQVVASGSHHESIRMILDGRVDAAAIDSNGMALMRRADPELEWSLRTLASWGPHPIQPVVVRRTLAPDLRRGIRAALLEMGSAPETRALCDAFLLERFVAAGESTYEAERKALAAEAPGRNGAFPAAGRPAGATAGPPAPAHLARRPPRIAPAWGPGRPPATARSGASRASSVAE